MQKLKYTFLWGQKQSAMITEIMANNITSGKGLMNRNISEDLAIYINGVVENYMSTKAIEEWRENSKKYFNKKFTEKLFKDIGSFIKEFFTYCGKLKNIDFKNLSNKELKKTVEKEEYFISKGLHFFATSSPGSTYFIENKIKEILSQNIKDRKLQEQYFIDINTPSQMDETMKERFDFFRILQKKKISDVDMENYSRKYPALFMNTYNKTEVMDFLREKIKNEKNDNADEEKSKIKNILKNTTQKHKKIFSEISDANLRYFSSIIQRAALGRYKLKHVWSGAEYMFLDVLEELRKRIDISFEDMIKSYMFSDIYNFLDKGIILNKKEIKDRKKCIVLHCFNYRDNLFYSGDKALNYRMGKVGDETVSLLDEESLKGQIANRGIIRGIVHLIFVRDIKQFNEDNKSFNKEEILVTTMTSPVMIPIIKKASAIVTDEGGICSHAAISAREFDIPCIVGTKIATKVLKDGDLVEVDANRGVVKIIKKSK